MFQNSRASPKTTALSRYIHFLKLACIPKKAKAISIGLHVLKHTCISGAGAHLKKLRRTEGGANIVGVFRVKNHDFTPKIHIFSNGSAPASPETKAITIGIQVLEHTCTCISIHSPKIIIHYIVGYYKFKCIMDNLIMLYDRWTDISLVLQKIVNHAIKRFFLLCVRSNEKI